MRSSEFQVLGKRLRRAGLLPAQIERMLTEMQEHQADLIDELERLGYPPAQARRRASLEFGSLQVIEMAARQRPELQQWPYRYPMLGRCLLPIATALIAPIPVVLRARDATSVLFRWGCILAISATITATLMLAMQMAIALP